MSKESDMSLDAPVMTRREALEQAKERLCSVVSYCLDLGFDPDEMDKQSIRKAYMMVDLALKGGAE